MFEMVPTHKDKVQTNRRKTRLVTVNAHIDGSGDNEAMTDIFGCWIPARHAHIAARYHARTYFRPVPPPAMRPTGWHSEVRTSRMTKKAQKAMLKDAAKKIAAARFAR